MHHDESIEVLLADQIYPVHPIIHAKTVEKAALNDASHTVSVHLL